MAIVGLVLSLVSFVGLLFFAAIAIPSLLRARVVANESAAIGDLRTLLSAEAGYAGYNDSQYDTLECLSTPSSCIPGNAVGPEVKMVEPGFMKSPSHGYRYTFTPGPASPAEGLGTRYSRSSVTSWTCVAEPVTYGQTGVRAFCVDESGFLCQNPGGAIQLQQGRCPPGCQPLH